VRRAAGLAVMAALAVVLGSGCGNGGTSPGNGSRSATIGASATPTASPSRSTGPADRTMTPSPSPSRTPSPTPTQSCAEQTLARLTPAERVGQVFMMGVPSTGLGPTTRAVLGEVRPGSVILVGNTTAGAVAVRTGVDEALSAADAPDGVTPFVAADQEGGQVQRLKGPGFSTIPSARAQGQLLPDRLEADAAQWAAELRAAGVTLDLAPVADVVPADVGARNRPIGALRRGYGSDPASVSASVRAFVAGMTGAGVATTLKHFPGLGTVTGNTDFTADVVDTRTTRADPLFAPFAAGIAEGAPFVMMSLATYSAIDAENLAAFSPVVLQGMLRGDLGFTGVVISDDLGIAAAVRTLPPAERALRFLRAGGDVVLTVDPAAARVMAQAVAADPALTPTVDAAALRVLRAKERFGLLAC